MPTSADSPRPPASVPVHRPAATYSAERRRVYRPCAIVTIDGQLVPATVRLWTREEDTGRWLAQVEHPQIRPDGTVDEERTSYDWYAGDTLVELWPVAPQPRT